MARPRFFEGESNAEELETWVRLAHPIYTRKRKDPRAASRTIRRPTVNTWFARPSGEGRTFNFIPELHKIQCPTLVMGGEDDPMIPIEAQEDIVAALSKHPVRSERIANCEHSVVTDAPERAFVVVREFIASSTSPL